MSSCGMEANCCTPHAYNQKYINHIQIDVQLHILYVLYMHILIRYFVTHSKWSVFTCSKIQGIGAISYAYEYTRHIRKYFNNSDSSTEPNMLQDKMMKPLLCIILF